MRLRIPLLGALATSVLALAAIVGFSASAAAPAPQESPATDVYVDLGDRFFNPRHLAVRANQPIRFLLSNTGNQGHEMSIAGQGREWTSERLTAGQSTTLTITFDAPGTYFVWCPAGTANSHRESGMVGTLTVVPEDEDPAPAIKVGLGEFFIAPLSIGTVAGPTRFELTNIGRFPHDLTIRGRNEEWTSGRIGAGETVVWSPTLTATGTYEVYCSIIAGTNNHRSAGMVGTLEVFPNARGMPSPAM